jgi:hypothetical protein
MKIYIPSMNPGNLKIKNLRSLDSFFRKKEDFTEFLSEEGIFILENDKLFRLAIKDDPVKRVAKGNLELIVDNSSCERIPLISQIPFEHSTVASTRLVFSQHDKSDLVFCVEGTYEKKPGADKYEGYVVQDCFFTTKTGKVDFLTEDDFEVFLSHL